MREIIFRGKRTDGGGWVEGSLIQEPHRTRIFTAKDDRSSSLHEVFPENVGQYVGQEDENGKKIFENDVFGTFGGDKEKPNEYEVHGFVKFDDGCWIVEKTNGGFEPLCEYMVNRVTSHEIIGNLTDNPELLK